MRPLPCETRWVLTRAPFSQIFEKIQASSNQTQKEKLESDLKTQIKKLQRLRDQIKTWMTSNDIKDKQPLIDNRKLIETVRRGRSRRLSATLRRWVDIVTDFLTMSISAQQMERFKACEKEMKTKAFSKEGLNAATKLDPKEQQKLEMCQWIQTMVEELSRQVEQSEAEVEQIQSVRQKKKDSEREQRLEELEHLNERRSWHINRLELILRLLENGNLQTDAVTNVKDDIAYFVESNTVRLPFPCT
jgi:CCR4-NOT transcription complex subunit 3